MLNPKVLLDALLAGAAKPSAPQANASQPANAVDLGEILRRIGGAQGGQGGGGGLGEILEKLGRAQQQGQGQGGGGGLPLPGGGGASGGGGLGDILGEIFGRAGQQQQRPAGDQGAGYETGGRMGQGQPQGAPAGGRDLLEEIFGPKSGQAQRAPQQQAPQQPPWGGGGRAMDARQRAEELLAALASGQGTPEMVEELKQMVASGQVNAGAVIGGLGSLVVGSKPGRRINAEAVRLGGLELIGAIAFNAFANYKQGHNPQASRQVPSGPAPQGSGFEAGAQSSEAALLYVRAMIAAAAADGQVDRVEQQQIIGGLDKLGLGQHATQFLQQEFESPQSIEDLVQATGGNPAVAIQTYAAARLAIEPDSRDEQAFLQGLAQAIGIDQNLAAHVDAQTTSLKV